MNSYIYEMIKDHKHKVANISRQRLQLHYLQKCERQLASLDTLLHSFVIVRNHYQHGEYLNHGHRLKNIA